MTILGSFSQRCKIDCHPGLNASEHQSWETYLAFTKYLASHRPLFFIFENVDAFLDVSDDPSADSNLEVLVNETKPYGYSTCPLKANVADFGLPQQRRRLFLVGLNLSRASRWQSFDGAAGQAKLLEFWERFQMSIQAMKMNSPSLQECLLPEDDEYVVAELKRRQEEAERRRDAKPSQRVQSSWPHVQAEYCRKLGVRESCIKASPDMLASPWYETLGPREQRALAISQHERRGTAGSSSSVMAADVSQQVGRVRVVMEPRRAGSQHGAEKENNQIQTDLESKLLIIAVSLVTFHVFTLVL